MKKKRIVLNKGIFMNLMIGLFVSGACKVRLLREMPSSQKTLSKKWTISNLTP